MRRGRGRPPLSRASSRAGLGGRWSQSGGPKSSSKSGSSYQSRGA